ncbi:tetratricopeptide repeat protein [Paenibacillus dokdonensis]|uniref:tetratricopeptide repeat protein n=1 Tax=Paenibacillus dokdonensis TaxID=2567944 RepID=UPI0010A7A58C|nr:hypothetical protein [Paenibacillus dokdonensis]
MKYAILGNLPWESFAYKEILDHLPEGEKYIFIGNNPEHESVECDYTFMNMDMWEVNGSSEYIAVVCSPFWIQQALGGGFSKVLFIMDVCPVEEDQQTWNKYSGLLAEASDLVITLSEKTYLEQSLQRRNLYWWDGEHEETEENHALLHLFVEHVAQGNSLDGLMRRQWEQRIQVYSRLHRQMGPHETISYLLASYWYFLEDTGAAQALQESFEMMLLREHHGTLHSHYRFFSAIEVQQGEIERAVYTYAITAVLPHEKETLARMKRWAAEERLELLKAELYRVNEDYRRAEEAVERDDSEEAAHFLADMYLEQWMWEKALNVMDRHQLLYKNGISREQVRAILLWTRGRKHEAVTELLRASIQDWNILMSFAETDLLEQAYHRLKERVNHGSGS